MADISILEPQVRPFVADCPALLVVTQLKRAAREFCQDTFVWQESYAVTVNADASVGVIPLLTDEAMISVVNAKVVGSDSFLVKVVSEHGLSISSGNPVGFAVSQPASIVVGPLPTADVTIDVNVVLKPSLSGSRVSDFVAEVWGEAIAHGAVAALLMMPGTDWYNPQQALYHSELFSSGKTDAKNLLGVGYNTGGSRASGGKFI